MSLSSPVPGTSRHTRQMQRSIMSRESRLVESAGQVSGASGLGHPQSPTGCMQPACLDRTLQSEVLSQASARPHWSLLKPSSAQCFTQCEAAGSACPDEGGASVPSPAQDPTPLPDSTLTLAPILPYLCALISNSDFFPSICS